MMIPGVLGHFSEQIFDRLQNGKHSSRRSVGAHVLQLRIRQREVESLLLAGHPLAVTVVDSATKVKVLMSRSPSLRKRTKPRSGRTTTFSPFGIPGRRGDIGACVNDPASPRQSCAAAVVLVPRLEAAQKGSANASPQMPFNDTAHFRLRRYDELSGDR